MSKLGDISGRLYSGDISLEFVGRRRLWYTISAVVLLACALGVIFRGLDFGVDFTGGSVFQFKTDKASVTEARSTVRQAGVGGEITVQEIGNSRWRVETVSLDSAEVARVQRQLAEQFGLQVNQISPTSIGPTWGQQISQKALLALAVFLGLLVVYLSITFEWKMAVAAIVALLHDIALTVGLYAIVGFAVTPATVIGLLSILGYSLYDTVVVFDKVRENTAGLLGGARMTYSQAANLAINQTVIRSVNTSVVALLPIGAILFVGAGLLGAGTLKDLALVLFVGTAAGTYSSVFLATPLVAQLKEREQPMRALARRVQARQTGGKSAGKPTKRAAKAATGDVDEGSGETASDGAGGEISENGVGEQAASESGGEPEKVGAASATPAASQGQGQQQRRQQPRRGSKRRSSGKKKR